MLTASSTENESGGKKGKLVLLLRRTHAAPLNTHAVCSSPPLPSLDLFGGVARGHKMIEM